MRRLFNGGKQELLRFQVRCSNPRVDRVPRLLGELKLDRPLRLLLHDNCAWGDMTTLDPSWTRSPTRSQPRNLLSMERLNSASSRVRWSSCSRIRMAQISFSFNGGFWPSSLPLFHGIARPAVVVTVSMNSSYVEGKELHVDPAQRTVVDPKQSSELLDGGHPGKYPRPTPSLSVRRTPARTALP